MDNCPSVADIRTDNLAALEPARVGILPDPGILAAAHASGDPTAIAECMLCLATALSGQGEVTEGQQKLKAIEAAVEDGVQLPHIWAWRLQTQLGLAANDHGDIAASWRHHHNALTLATEEEFGDALIVSNINLAYVESTIELYPEALNRLIFVLGSPQRVPEHEIAAHLLLAELFSRQGTVGSAQEHRDRALEIAKRIASPRVARTINGMALMCHDLDNALEYVRLSHELPKFGPTQLVSIEHAVLDARLEHQDGDPEEAIAMLFSIVDTCEQGLAIRALALVLLAGYLSEGNHHQDALTVLEDVDLADHPPTHRATILQLRRDALRSLQRWEEAADCFEALRRTQRAHQLDVLSVYKLQQAANEADLVSTQNDALLANKASLEAVSTEKGTILDLVANELQSPLDELRAAVSELQGDPLPAERARWAAKSRKTIAEIENVAQGLALVGQLRSGELHLVVSPVPLGRSFDSVSSAMSDTMQSRGITAQWPDPADDPTVSADPERLRQLLIALMRGITEFSGLDTSIVVGIGQPDHRHALVSIETPEFELSVLNIDRLRRSQSTAQVRSTDNPTAGRSFYVADGLARAMRFRLSATGYAKHGMRFELALPLHVASRAATSDQDVPAP